ncbi:MAG TPA: hypothetical protein VFB38_01600 [Chthonomonadaceae bacterium]|nr:hypothetical protein [Chthonomonadaceae bacterium]
MLPRRTMGWWYWLATVGLLAAHFLRSPVALWLAIALTGVQVVHHAILEGDARAFSVQIRMAFLGLLLLGVWEPLRFVHGVQLAGTTAIVLFDYCLLGRILSLMPWNRRAPLSLALAIRTIFSRPGCGSMLERVQPQKA